MRKSVESAQLVQKIWSVHLKPLPLAGIWVHWLIRNKQLDGQNCCSLTVKSACLHLWFFYGSFTLSPPFEIQLSLICQQILWIRRDEHLCMYVCICVVYVSRWLRCIIFEQLKQIFCVLIKAAHTKVSAQTHTYTYAYIYIYIFIFACNAAGYRLSAHLLFEIA